jgi:hypothetical protein
VKKSLALFPEVTTRIAGFRRRQQRRIVPGVRVTAFLVEVTNRAEADYFQEAAAAWAGVGDGK